MATNRELLEAKPVESLTAVLTSACNLQCRYCYRSAGGQKHLSWPDLRRALDWSLEASGSRLQVSFSGGEPLLAFSTLTQAVAYLEDRSSRPDHISFKVLTNGILMNEEIGDFLAGHSIDTQLSFDGVPAAQKLRGRRTFTVLDQLLDRLRARLPDYVRHRLAVSVTVLPETVPFLAESVSYLLNKGVQRILLAPSLMPTSGGHSAAEELERQFQRITQESLAHLDRTGEVPLQLFVRWQPEIPRTAGNETPLCSLVCGRAPAVDEYGNIHACETFSGAGWRLTETRHSRILEGVRWGKPGTGDFDARRRESSRLAASSTLFAPQAEKYSGFGRCADCRYITDCLICPVALAANARNGDDLRIPDFLCAFSRAAFKSRRSFPARPLPDRIRRHPAVLGASIDRLLARLRQKSPPETHRLSLKSSLGLDGQRSATDVNNGEN